jgi:glutamyl-tRNA(Gln) amidotransferase subunit D
MENVKIHLARENSEILSGILVNKDDKHVVLKLESGYNIGIKNSNIKRIEKVSELPVSDEKGTISKENSLNHMHNSRTPKILILHTGGTIASKVDYKTGAVVAKFSPEELLGMFPELKDIAHIDSKLFRNMMSDDMRFAHYNLIAEQIKTEIEDKSNKDLKGIIITHGTDTLHYTSAALSFMFEHLPIPVVLVGSQRSSDRGSSDSAMNIISAAAFVANTSLSGVFICMHENMSDETCVILNGLNVRKMHSSRRDAFKQINYEPVARVNFSDKSIEYISIQTESTLNSPGKLEIFPFNEKLKIGMLQSHPNMNAAEILNYKDFDGLVLMGTGLGHMPITEMDEFTKEHTTINHALKDLSGKIPVVMSSQTIYGTVNMNVYSPGRELIEMGVLGTESKLTPETTFIKLAWLLSQKLDVKENFSKSFRGEYNISGTC